MTRKALTPLVLPNDPAAPYEAATKKYVDDAVLTGDWKQSVRVASTANVAGTYTPGLGGGTPTPGALTGMPNTIDGITLVVPDRVLLKNQTNAASNGIWYVTTVGTGANGVWDRPPDFGGGLINGYAAQTSAPGVMVAVEQGTTNADTLWLMTNDRPIQIDGGGSPTLQTWVQIGASGGGGAAPLPHTAVKLATAASIVFNGASGGNLTIDGIPVGTGDRVLIKDSTTPAFNGIYVANTGGTWGRATDLDTWAEAAGTIVTTTDGQINGGTAWFCTAPVSGTLGTTAMTWVQLEGPTNTTLIGALYLGSGTATYQGPLTVPGAALTAYTDGSFRLWSIVGGVATLVFGGSSSVVTSWLAHQTLAGLDNFAGFAGAVTARIMPDGTITSQNLPGLNRLDNGNFQIWQRGLSITPGAASTGVYTADRWMVRSTGAALSAINGQDVAVNRRAATRYALQCVGNTGVTGLSIYQRMDAEAVARLFQTNGSVTFSFAIQNTTGADFTPTLVLTTPTALDDYSALNAASLTQVLANCPNGFYTVVSFTVAAATMAAYTMIGNGLQVELTIPAANMNANTKNLGLYAAKVETGSVPTPMIPLDYQTELVRCQRFFHRVQSLGTQHFLCNFAQTTSAAGYGIYTYPTRMRAVPVCTVSAQNHASTFVGAATTVGTVFSGACTPESARVQVSATGTQGWAGYMMLNTSTAWIQFSAEL